MKQNVQNELIFASCMANILKRHVQLALATTTYMANEKQMTDLKPPLYVKRKASISVYKTVRLARHLDIFY